VCAHGFTDEPGPRGWRLQTKYLNDIFVVSRGDYANLPQIVSWSIAIGFIVPLAAIVALGRRVR
jgi:hypothetical protein